MNQNLNKGNTLERAVGIIETIILEQNPNLINKPFLIENKKTIIVDGVRHEVDWYIEIDLGDGYKSIYIFECKNWEEKIGKNEIIIFSELISATGAVKGYFIAKNFGKYAVAQAKLNSRMTLLDAREDLVELIDYPHFHSSRCDLDFVRIDFIFDNWNEQDKDLSITTILVDGELVDFQEFALKVGNDVMNEYLKKIPTAHLATDTYHFETQKHLKFQNQIVIVENIRQIRFRVTIKFSLKIKRPKLLSKFDIKTRGRVIEYDDFIFMLDPEKQKATVVFKDLSFFK